MTTIIPHGGKLINRLVEDENEKQELINKSGSLEKILLSPRDISDVELIAIGGYSPLTGFMSNDEYQSVINTMHLPGDIPWTIPILLSVPDEQQDKINVNDEINLSDKNDNLIGIMTVTDKFNINKKELAKKVFGTEDEAHPGVAAEYRMTDTCIGGPIKVINRPNKDIFPKYRIDPKDTRRKFIENGWKTIVAFQTRNPVHRAHEYLQKCAMEIVDGLLLHPIVGETKSDDISAEIRMKCYETILENYYPADRAMLAINPAAMRYGGPKEAIFHSIVRKNYGCTHFIVGRDHAGVGDYYGTYDAQKIFDEFDHDKLGIQPLKFEHSFFCKKCGNMASIKTCPHPSSEHVFLSGTKVREMLNNGQCPPPEFSRPEVAQVLIEAYR